MELRVLNYFLTVAQEGNITTAASLLHVGQPALSRQLKGLERELGKQLFVRQSHGVRLTSEGELLRIYAQQMMDISDKVEMEFAMMHSKPLGDVYIGGFESHCLHRFVQVFRVMHDENPTISFHYYVGHFPDVSAKLDQGVLDFGFVSEPVRFDRYESLDLPFNERWVAYMRADNPLASKPSVTAADLAKEPLLMYDQVMNYPLEGNNVASWFGKYFSQLNVVATSNLSFANNVFAQEGLGTLITWEGLAPTDRDDMVVRRLDPLLLSHKALIWCKDRPLRPAAARFLEAVKEYLL